MLGLEAKSVPKVRFENAQSTFMFIEDIISEGLVKSAHDCSEGGFAVALAEMCIGGCIGCKIDIANIMPAEAEELDEKERETMMLFSESQTRFLLEVDYSLLDDVLRHAREKKVAAYRLGKVSDEKMVVNFGNRILIQIDVEELRNSWLNALKL